MVGLNAAFAAEVYVWPPSPKKISDKPKSPASGPPKI
jgi:hypothetical protein